VFIGITKSTVLDFMRDCEIIFRKTAPSCPSLARFSLFVNVLKSNDPMSASLPILRSITLTKNERSRSVIKFL